MKSDKELFINQIPYANEKIISKENYNNLFKLKNG